LTGRLEKARPVAEFALSRVVLVVDDEPLVLDITTSMLEDLGCEVITATNAFDAMAKLAADPRIEVLITDIHMPGMDGYELAERARRLKKGLQVIVVSGKDGGRPGVPIVRKPFGRPELARMMQRTTGLC
jgi:two-component system cell cycle response regulator CpdR